jgi:hypothetical protein
MGSQEAQPARQNILRKLLSTNNRQSSMSTWSGVGSLPTILVPPGQTNGLVERLTVAVGTQAIVA